MTFSAHIIHAHILDGKISWNYDLNKLKIRLFIGLTILHKAACSLTVWHTACHTMRYMMELLEAVAVQQVRERCICMSNNSPTLVQDATCTRHPATHPCTHTCAGSHAPTPIYLSSKLSLKSQFLWPGFA